MIPHNPRSTLLPRRSQTRAGYALRSVLLVTALPLAIVGCRTNPTAGFNDVQKTLAERSGHEIVWPLTAEANEQANTKVRELLAQELTAESAVQVALLNNRHLRSTFEELDISRADVIQAAL